METLINIEILAFGLLLMAGALFGRGERVQLARELTKLTIVGTADAQNDAQNEDSCP